MDDDDGDDNEWEDMEEDHDNANNGDDDSWETVDSDDNHINNNEDGKVAPSPTSLIYKFFKQNTYGQAPRGMLYYY